jgi:hypothetical protein
MLSYKKNMLERKAFCMYHRRPAGCRRGWELARYISGKSGGLGEVVSTSGRTCFENGTF